MRRCNTVGLAAFAVLGLGACALEPGAPWGEVAVTLEVGLAGGAGRFDPEGRVRTDRDFRVAVTTTGKDIAYSVSLGGTSLPMSESGESAAKLLRELGARVTVVPSDDGIAIDLDRILAAITERTRLVAISHVLFRSAYIMDAAAI
jgi:kynureninase